MKNKWIIILFFAGVLGAGCKSGNSNAIAGEMCNCFNTLKDSLPPEAVKIFEEAATAANPEETFKTEMAKLTLEQAVHVNNALRSTAKPGSPANNCIKELDRKYQTTAANRQEMAQKMIDEIKDKKGCDIMMALLRMNLKK